MLLGWEWGWCLKYYVKLFGGVGVGWGLGCLKYYVKFFGGGGLKLKDLLVRFVVVKEIHIVCILITARCSMIVHFLNKILYKK